jgi:hypothetical protein
MAVQAHLVRGEKKKAGATRAEGSIHWHCNGIAVLDRDSGGWHAASPQ